MITKATRLDLQTGALMQDKVVGVDDRVSKDLSPGIKGNCPVGIAKKDKHLVKCEIS